MQHTHARVRAHAVSSMNARSNYCKRVVVIVVVVVSSAPGLEVR